MFRAVEFVKNVGNRQKIHIGQWQQNIPKECAYEKKDEI